MAEYSTEPFKESPYYAWRIGKRRWSLELIHHKLYLENKPEDVQHFEVIHGYNLLTANRILKERRFILRLGAGPVIAHPETEVCRKRFSNLEGDLFGTRHFMVAGACGQISAEKRILLTKWTLLWYSL
jgi:hypothetical protein